MARPRILTDEQRKQSVKNYKAKVRNVTIDEDLVELLNKYADGLETEFNFRPTLSQTLRVMLKRGAK